MSLLAGTLLFSSCEYKLQDAYSDLPEGRQRDSLKYLHYNSMTYGTVLHVHSDTLTLLAEPTLKALKGKSEEEVLNVLKVKGEPVENGTTLIVTDFTKMPVNIKTTALTGETKTTAMDITFAKVSYEGGEGWQLPSVIKDSTAPDNFTRFLPQGASKKVKWWMLGISLLAAAAYVIIKKKSKDEKIAVSMFAPILFYIMMVLIAIAWVTLQWTEGASWDFLMRHFWSWSMHPFFAKVFVVMSVAFVPLTLFTLYEIWLNTRPSVGKALFHVAGVVVTSVALWAAVMITFVLFMVIVMAVFAGAAVAAQGASGGNTCPRCGHTWVKGHGYKCPNCGMV